MLCCSVLQIFILVSLLFPRFAAQNTVVEVDPDGGVNDASCLPPNPTHACQDVGYALKNKTDSITYELKAGTTTEHYLDNHGADVFMNVHYIALVSSNLSESVAVQCKPGAGLAFQNSTNIRIKNVQFWNCGALRNSTSTDFSQQSLSLLNFNVSLYFYQCFGVTLDRVVVMSNTVSTGVVMYDTIGSNKISHSVFFGYSPGYTLGSLYGGGGFAVEFTYCSPGDSVCDIRSQMNKDSTYVFDNCTFKDNHAYSQNGTYFDSSFLFPGKENHQSFGRGGGLSLYFKSDASNNSFYLRNCCFSHNCADWGGGILVEFHDSTTLNTVEIEQAYFLHNHARVNELGKAGGGARVASYVNRAHNELAGNRVTFARCNFTNNKAWNGGGISISLALQDMNHSQLTSVTVKNSYFEENRARLGSAFEVGHLPMFRAGSFGSITLSECIFISNQIQGGFNVKKLYYSAGIGTVYTNEISIYFNSSVYFEGNSGTAVAIAGGTLHFEDCNATFSKNKGRNGGAIALLGAAHIVVSNQTSMGFYNNSAIDNGGAIYNRYIGLEDMQTYRKCFILHNNGLLRPEDWGAKFLFYHNSAGQLGNSIYSSSILPCAWSSKKTDEVIERIFRWKNWIYSPPNDTEISSEQYTFNITTAAAKVFPGQRVKLNISTRNELGYDITDQTVYLANIRDSKVRVKPEYTYIMAAGYFAVTGEANNATLYLETFGSQNWHLSINLDVLNCPPGMNLITDDELNQTATCGCRNVTIFRNKVLCLAESDDFVTKIRNGYWIGKLHSNSTGDELFVGQCPYKYCHINSHDYYVTLPAAGGSEYLDETLCNEQNRQGIMCGECKPGYSNAINSHHFQCVPCNGTNTGRNVAIYLATSYLPLLIFLICIICFNIRLTTGPVNAYILFAQVVGANIVDIPLFFDTSHDKVHRAYTFLYGTFNLNFFSILLDPFCVNENFNTLDTLLLQYALAAFPLGMIVIVTVCIRLADCCTWKWDSLFKKGPMSDSSARVQNRTKTVGAALVHAFVAFVLLSYTKICLASINILTLTTVYDAYGHTHGYPRSYHAGQYSLSDTTYIVKYCLPAILVLIFFATPPLLLLGPLNWFNNRATKYRCLRRIWPQDKVHIILDTFQGCFKPKMRFFAGIYFLFRLVLFISFVFTPDYFQQYVIQMILLLLLFAMLALFQPYQKHFLNCIDILVVLNLGIINALSIYVVSSDTTVVSKTVLSLQNALIYIPLFCLVCYLTSLILNKSRLSVWLKLKEKVIAMFSKPVCETPRVPLLSTSLLAQPAYDSLSDESVLLARANEPNRFCRPATTQAEDKGAGKIIGSHTSDNYGSGIKMSGPYDEQPTTMHPNIN